MKEDHISQIPALQLLINLGFKYLTPDEALSLRSGKTSNVILEKVLFNWLKENNTVEYRGGEYEFSNNNITRAVDDLMHVRYDGLVRTNEKIYDMLVMGRSFDEDIRGDLKSYSLKYIDWDDPGNNIYHVTEEFSVDKRDGRSHRRPDIVIFVNGIPLVVIECKKPGLDKPIEQAVSQHLRNQHDDEIPRLFIFSQILMAISKNEGKYATTGTEKRWWSMWREEEDPEPMVSRFVNSPLPSDVKDKLFSTRFRYVRYYFDELEKNRREITGQDRTLYALCRPERLLELTKFFIVYDAGVKKIARYQQYHAVKKAMKRIKKYGEKGRRLGGVIWHTQGSGKSLTMVMLAKKLALDDDIQNPRIVIVTDRVNLDTQIWGTFKKCGLEPVKAKTGEHLLELLKNENKQIITSVINKFEAGLNKQDLRMNDDNIFVLVDEGHRSQYGAFHAKMEKALPGACYIGFTGTPLTKREKNTLQKFGDFIDKYTMDRGVKDKAIVPLLYEGRHTRQSLDRENIDKWFDRITRDLTDGQKADLKRKYSRLKELKETAGEISEMAFDISVHFQDNWQNTGFKAQLAVSSKEAAIKFKKAFDEFGMISSEVIISPPDEREGQESTDSKPKDLVIRFWKRMMAKYQKEESYNREIIGKFGSDGDPEILIVVDKLLTGFDEPRNTVLYIAKPLKDHTLLQAIARVNRVYNDKEFGYIIDYQGILENLDKALTDYRALEGFELEDILGSLTNVETEIKALDRKYEALMDIFKGIKNRRDEEEYEKLLVNVEKRENFYEKLSAYSRILALALSTVKFYEDHAESDVKNFKDKLKFFQNLRVSVQKRYGERIDLGDYKPKIKKLLDQFVSTEEIVVLTEEPVNIFDRTKFEEEVEKLLGNASRADTIAHRTLRSIRVKYDEDPVYYEKFSGLIKKAIEDYGLKRINELEYLNLVRKYMESLIQRKDEKEPEILQGQNEAKAFYGVLGKVIEKTHELDDEKRDHVAGIGLELDKIIKGNLMVDWQRKDDVQKRMIDKIEDYLLDKSGIDWDYEQIDEILERIMKIARVRYAS